MPQETKKQYDNPAASIPSLQGLIADASDERALVGALENAFDYRGDVTIARADGTTVEGYIFDRTRGDTLATSTVRLMNSAGERIAVRFDEIAKLEFSGKDAAAGKGFDRWIERYIEKKRAGEEASIQSEELG